MSEPELHGAGVWIKVASRSDLAAYARALDLMGLNGLQKTTALRLIEGVEIQQDATTFSVNFLTVVPFFKVIPCTLPYANFSYPHAFSVPKTQTSLPWPEA